jgi:hypothetical protein
MSDYFPAEVRKGYRRGQFPLAVKIGGEYWTIYSVRNYDTKEAAEVDAAWLKSQGYRTRIRYAGGKYWVCWRKK